jgi:hypothetical protein
MYDFKIFFRGFYPRTPFKQGRGREERREGGREGGWGREGGREGGERRVEGWEGREEGREGRERGMYASIHQRGGSEALIRL